MGAVARGTPADGLRSAAQEEQERFDITLSRISSVTAERFPPAVRSPRIRLRPAPWAWGLVRRRSGVGGPAVPIAALLGGARYYVITEGGRRGAASLWILGISEMVGVAGFEPTTP